jgi:heme oxygenase
MEDGLNDPYDSLNLDDLKEARILSEPIEAFTVDFNDFEYLRNVVLANKLYKKITLTANKRGEASCVVGWFR